MFYISIYEKRNKNEVLFTEYKADVASRIKISPWTFLKFFVESNLLNNRETITPETTLYISTWPISTFIYLFLFNLIFDR